MEHIPRHVIHTDKPGYSKKISFILLYYYMESSDELYTYLFEPEVTGDKINIPYL